MGPGNDLYEGRFAGSVFTEEGVNFTRMEIQRNTFKSADRTEGFGDLVELEEGVQRASKTSFSYFLINRSQASPTGTDLESQ